MGNPRVISAKYCTQTASGYCRGLSVLTDSREKKKEM